MPDPKTFAPGPKPGTVLSPEGKTLTPPGHWSLLPPGDAGLTRRVKASGDFWLVQEKKGRKMFSHGVWADSQVIAKEREKLDVERSGDAYTKKMEASARRREKVQNEYVEDFRETVLGFLAFHPDHQAWAQKLAQMVTEHATPVGSGTVARTQRIPVEQRAEAAVIAWMRHQTTAYDDMVIPRVKGKRREVRRMLAKRSHQLLARYRGAGVCGAEGCPLQAALSASSDL